MYLTASFKLRANDHDRKRLRVALSRWSAAFAEAMERAHADQRRLLRCLVMKETKRGQQLAVDGRTLHALVLGYCRGLPAHLHSASAMSLIVAVEEQLASWLGLYRDWIAGGRKLPKPAFPHVAAPHPGIAQERYEAALLGNQREMTRREEDLWRAEVSRHARGRRFPLYFGAATSGGERGMAHMGLMTREDGRYFALLTLFPAGDALGEPVTRARNRVRVGDVRNVRAEKPFAPTDRAKSSLMVPLEMHRGHEQLFIKRAVPKSAEIVERTGDYFLHVAFEFPEALPRELSGAVCAVVRGMKTLLAAIVLDSEGREIERRAITGRDLSRKITEILAARRKQQEKGRLLTGDRRAKRVAEHHLYSAGHQIVSLACDHGARIVLLEDRYGRKPNPMLAYRHFHRLGEILTQLSAEAGLPNPPVRPVYGSWRTCPHCGWTGKQWVRREDVSGDSCPGCGTGRDEEFHLARLLALDALRLERDRAGRPALPEFVRELRSGR